MINTKKHSVQVCGCARDVEKHLPGVLANFAAIGGLFLDASYVVVTNDNSDGTLSALTEWSNSGPDRKVVNLDGMANRLKSRTERLPECRNACLDELWKNRKDFLVVLDMDGICQEPIPMANILTSFKHDGWAAMTANTSKYYDIWALRSPWCPYDCWRMVHQRPSSMSGEEAVNAYIHAHKKVIPRETPPIEVESAFNGLGIYKASAIEGCRYSMKSTFHGADVEHVAFNQGIRRRGGKVFINPAMLIR